MSPNLLLRIKLIMEKVNKGTPEANLLQEKQKMINPGEEGLMRIERKSHSATIDLTVTIEGKETDPETLPGEKEICTDDMIEMTPIGGRIDSQEMGGEKAIKKKKDTTTTEEAMEAPTETDQTAGTESPRQEACLMR